MIIHKGKITLQRFLQNNIQIFNTGLSRSRYWLAIDTSRDNLYSIECKVISDHYGWRKLWHNANDALRIRISPQLITLVLLEDNKHTEILATTLAMLFEKEFSTDGQLADAVIFS